MKVLLDENFPLGLVRALHADGVQVDHIITLNLRGVPDSHIRDRLSDRDLVFLTQDEDSSQVHPSSQPLSCHGFANLVP